MPDIARPETIWRFAGLPTRPAIVVSTGVAGGYTFDVLGTPAGTFNDNGAGGVSFLPGDLTGNLDIVFQIDGSLTLADT